MVEGARAEIGSDSELVARALLRRLRALTPEDIKQFQQLWEQARDDVYRWPISDAATLLLGPSTDYDFPARRHFPRLTAYLDDNPWMWRPWERPDD